MDGSKIKKNIILSLTFLSIFVIFVLGVLFSRGISRYAYREILEESEMVLRSLNFYIEGSIKTVEDQAGILAKTQAIVNYFENNTELKNVDKDLDNFKENTGADVVYIMDMNGKVKASSNRNKRDSFVGKDYSFRPYFLAAKKGERGRYFAKGVTSKKKGFYSSCPVLSRIGETIGVVVIKKNMDNVETILFGYDNCFMIDKRFGVVFLAGDKEGALQLLWPYPEEAGIHEQLEEQYGQIKDESIFDRKLANNERVPFLGKDTIFTMLEFPGMDMALVKFSSAERIKLYALAGIIVTLLGLLFSGCFCWGLLLIYRSRDKMREEKEINERMFRLTPSAVFTVDPDRKIMSWNKKCEEITGFMADEVIGKDCSIFADFPCDKKCGVYSEDVVKPMRGVECAIRTKEGEKRIIRKNSDLLTTEQGKVIGAIESFDDVTETIESETKIRQLLQAVEQSRSIIVIADTEGNITYVNPAFTKITGYTPEEVIGKNPRMLKTDYLPRKVYKNLWETITSGHTWTGEFLNKKKAGTNYWERALISPVRDAKGKIINYIAVKEDITEQKANEEALLRSEERLSLAFNAINEGLWDYKPQADSYYLSPTWYTMLGYEPEEMPPTYKTWKSLIHPEDVERTEAAFREFISKSRETFDIEFRMKAKDGKWHWIHSRAKTFERDERGMVKRMVGTHSDITKRKKAEIEKDKALQVKSKFTSMVSHELRTPLTAIKGGVDLVLEGFVGEINNDQKDLLERAQHNVDRLHRLINDILDFQKLDGGMMSFDLALCDIGKLAADTYESMKPVVEEKGLKMNLELGKDLPDIKIDIDRVTQVLMNLINNAIKFTENGEIGVRVFKDHNLMHFSVWDTGPGIKEEDKRKLFKSFQQLDTTKEKKREGTGLGLAISKEIVQKHRGKIWVESVFGRGSEFHFILPIVERRRDHVEDDPDS